MRITSIVFLLFSGLLFSQTSVPEGYQKIPEILDTTDYLYPFIKPHKKYEFWKVLRNLQDPEKAVIYESQMPESRNINEPAPEKGFFQECQTEGCFSYIIACNNNQSEYFSNEQQLRDFIDYIDNLPEALLIAKTYGFSFDSKDRPGGSYKIEDKHILLYLSKSKGCPETKESFWVKINRNTGKLESKSNGIYFKAENCVD